MAGLERTAQLCETIAGGYQRAGDQYHPVGKVTHWAASGPRLYRPDLAGSANVGRPGHILLAYFVKKSALPGSSMQMTAPTASLSQSRTRWSLGATLVVHIALAALVLRQPLHDLVPRMSPHRPIEFRLRERPPVRQPEAQNPSSSLLRAPEKRPPSLASMPSPREHLRRPASVPSVHPNGKAPTETPPQPEPRDLRKVDLLPGGVLRRLSEEGSSARPPTAQSREGDVSPQDVNARLAQERVQGFLESGRARDRVRSGLINPVWRDLETSILDLFKPPEALVRSGRSSMTIGERLGNQVSSIVEQILRSPGQVEKGTLARGEFAERGPMGELENSYRNGLASQQSKAVMDAWKKPASWRHTEVELVITTAGEVESVRVISKCGVKKLDTLAVETIERAAHKLLGSYRGQRTVTTWAFDSAYAANVPFGSLGLLQGGFRFDETGLGNKNARGSGNYISDPEYLVGGNIHTKVSLLSLRELQE